MANLLSKEKLEEIKNGSVLLMGESKDLAATALHFIEEFDKAIVAFRNAAQGLLVAEAQLAELGKQEPVAWIHEDELPESYPYDAMFPFSKVDIVRIFPIYGPPLTSAERERLNTLERVVAGLPQEAIEGGWTAKGISDHAKSLENRLAQGAKVLSVMPSDGQFVAVWSNGAQVWSATMKFEDGQLKSYNNEGDCWDFECDHGFTRRFFESRKAVFYAAITGQPQSPLPVVTDSGVTAEHRRVIEMLLSVCAAAFELADDACEAEIDGEVSYTVPQSAIEKLGDALEEIENTLPTEDADRPDVFLAWSAMPRAALKSLLQLSSNSEQVTPTISFYRDGIVAAAQWVEKKREAYDSEHGQHDPDTGTFEFGNDAQQEYSETLRDIEEGIRTLHPNAASNYPVIPEGWALVPIEPTESMIIDGFESEPDESFSKPEDWEAYQAMSGCEKAGHRARLCWSAMIAAAPPKLSEPE